MSYTEFEFSKDLMQQFQSDKALFTLLAVIILFVATSNIISYLIMLVHDKKQEIAILQALGASKKSIAAIFGLSGLIIGLSSSLLGSLAAYFTLKHIDTLVHILNTLQGHPVFHPAFFGATLPNALSLEALIFVVALTPIFSLLAGLIPAIQACRINPSAQLRAQ